jgi:hypothetical protein
MTALVLEKLNEMDPEAFAEEAEAIWGGESAAASPVEAEADALPPPAKRHAPPRPSPSATAPAPMAPPANLPKRVPQRLPEGAPRSLMRDLASISGSGGNPPVTITGVAPWAMQQKRSVQARFPTSSVPQASVAATEQKEPEQQQQATSSNDSAQSGLERVLHYIARLKPPKHDDGPSWHDLHVAPTPTLLPSLKFHDLVFGHSLGSGAFSTVKYARHILKDKTRSQWPEYAVKIISTEKMRVCQQQPPFSIWCDVRLQHD